MRSTDAGGCAGVGALQPGGGAPQNRKPLAWQEGPRWSRCVSEGSAAASELLGPGRCQKQKDTPNTASSDNKQFFFRAHGYLLFRGVVICKYYY